MLDRFIAKGRTIRLSDRRRMVEWRNSHRVRLRGMDSSEALVTYHDGWYWLSVWEAKGAEMELVIEIRCRDRGQVYLDAQYDVLALLHALIALADAPDDDRVVVDCGSGSLVLMSRQQVSQTNGTIIAWKDTGAE
jgi:hypothetical protein